MITRAPERERVMSLPDVPPSRVRRLRGRRRQGWEAVAVAVVLFLGGSAVAMAVRSKAHPSVPPVQVPDVVDSLVLSVSDGRPPMVAVILHAASRPAVVVAVPPQTLVDIPGGGPASVGQATGPKGDDGLLVAAVEAALNIPVSHYLRTDLAGLGSVVDRLGGLAILLGEREALGGRTIGPGTVRLTGKQVQAYLSTAQGVDERAIRWESLLSGLFAEGAPAWPRAGTIRSTDDRLVAVGILGSALGATVVQLPGLPQPGGALQPDVPAVASMIKSQVAASPPQLVPMVVVNGNGQPGMGAAVASLLGPAGFRLMAAQNGQSFDVAETKILASSPSWLPQAQEVRSLLGAGKVYLAAEPAGVGVITILVGKDFQGDLRTGNGGDGAP